MTAIQPDALPHLLINVSESTKNYLRQCSHSYILSKKESLPELKYPPDSVVFIEEGWLALSIHGTVISILKAGETYMGPVLPTGHSCSGLSVTLTAVTPARAILIPRAQLSRTLNERPDILFVLYDHACSRLTSIYTRLARFHADPLEMRLVSFLWGIGLPTAAGHRFIPPITQDVLASCLGTAREEVSRKRQILIQNGQLLKENGSWYVHKNVAIFLESRGYAD